MPKIALKSVGTIFPRVRSWKARLDGSGRDNLVCFEVACRRTAFLKSETEESGVKPYLRLTECSASDLAWMSFALASFSSFSNVCLAWARWRLMHWSMYRRLQRRLRRELDFRDSLRGLEWFLGSLPSLLAPSSGLVPPTLALLVGCSAASRWAWVGCVHSGGTV